jgi:RNA polymerase sigma-70 factor (ECF subfamily)
VNAWASALVNDNRRVLSQYYRQYHQELCRYAVNKFGVSTTEAEDLVHNAFARFTAMMDQSQVDNVRAFLYKAVHNACVDAMRRHQVRENYAQAVQSVPEPELDVIGPERVAVGRQLLELISGALWAMPGKRRRLLIMNRVDGLTYAEIARREGLSETVVRKHVSKALAGCQKALASGGEN